MLPQVLQVGAGWQVLLDQLAGRRREQDLPTMSSAHDASSVMHVHPNVAISSQHRLTGMQTNTHPDRGTAGPGMFYEGSLYGSGSRNRIGGTSKGDEKRVSLGIDLVTVVLLEHAAQ